MRHNDDAFATILLMSQITPDREELVLPLSVNEYHQLRRDVRGSDLHSLGRLIDLDMSGMSEALGVTEQEAYRLCMLMNRQLPLSMSIERFYEKNLDIITMEDWGYPERLRGRLGVKMPPMLYFAGRPEIFRQQAIAILGATGANRGAEEVVRALVRDAVERDFVIVTDGMEGIGRIAEDEAFEHAGRVIEVLAGSLTDRVRDERMADMLSERRVLIISPTHPDAPYTNSHALRRNKLLYALSEAAFVFAAENGRGACWDGATEALRNRHCEFVYAWDTDAYPGNRALLSMGAIAYRGGDLEPLARNWASASAEQLSFLDWKEPLPRS